MLAHAHTCRYANTCTRKHAYAHVSKHMPTYASICHGLNLQLALAFEALASSTSQHLAKTNRWGSHTYSSRVRHQALSVSYRTIAPSNTFATQKISVVCCCHQTYCQRVASKVLQERSSELT
jgi:hypothetical protein